MPPAAPASKAATRQAEVDRLTAQLAAERSDLATRLADFQRVDAALADTDSRIADEMVQLTRAEGTLAEEQALLDGRADHLYRTSGQDLMTIILGTRSLSDLVARVDYLVIVSGHDAQLLADVKTTREQLLTIEQGLEQQQTQQQTLRQQAQAQLQRMQREIAAHSGQLTSAQQQVAQLVGQQQQQFSAAGAVAPLAVAGGGLSGAAAAAFSPNTLISDADFTASASMSAAQIQAFLNAQGGALRAYAGRDHAGAWKSAAQMIADAGRAWGVSPKVILVTLQKEQSLIANASPSGYALDWAMGCGKTDSVTYTKYRGFGNQVWFGAKTLASHRAGFRPGESLGIDGASVYPTNASTQSLYSYTPHFGGNTSFWTLYWRYFGSPL